MLEDDATVVTRVSCRIAEATQWLSNTQISSCVALVSCQCQVRSQHVVELGSYVLKS